MPAFSSNNFVPPYSYTFTDGCGKTWKLNCYDCTSSSGFAYAIDNWKKTHQIGTWNAVPCYSSTPTIPNEVPA